MARFSVKDNQYYYGIEPGKKLIHPLVKNNNTLYLSTEDLSNTLGLTVDENSKEVNVMDRLDDSWMSGFVVEKIEKDKIEVSLHGEKAYMMVENAKITDYDTGKVVKITSDDQGRQLVAKVPPVMIIIYPPQYSPSELVLLPKDMSAMAAVVKSVTQEGVLVACQGSEYLILVDKETVIENQQGDTIQLSNIKVGNEILAYHSQIMTRSLPGQTQGYKLVVGAPLDLEGK